MTRDLHPRSSVPAPRSGLRAVLATALLVGAAAAQAATITVTTTADELNAGGACSLREAVQAANTDAAVGGCSAGSGADTIVVPAGTYVLTLAGSSEDGNATGDLDVAGDVTVTGAGSGTTIVDGNATDRVLHVVSGVVVVEDVTVRNGRAPSGAAGASCLNVDFCFKDGGSGEEGGGILTSGGTNLTLRRVVLADSQAGAGGKGGDVNCPDAGVTCYTNGGEGGNGGGVSAHGALTIADSVVQNNRSGAGGAPGQEVACGVGGDCNAFAGNPGDGAGVIVTGAALDLATSTVKDNTSPDWAGGVYCHHGSTCTIRDTTISGNTAGGLGGGLAGITTTTTVKNTTISGNHAQSGGGVGINSGAVTLSFVTVAGNTATFRGGNVQAIGGITIASTIVADGSPSDCYGTLTSGGYNLVENTADCTFTTTTGDATGTDPQLSPLAPNGGPTETQAIASTSPAKDQIPSGTNGCGTATPVDQRGIVRPQDYKCDKGAFEVVGQPPLAGDVLLPGTKARLIDASSPAGRKSYLALRAPTTDGIPIPDPRVTGATAYIARPGGPVTVVELPASGWAATGNTPRVDYKFKSRGETVLAARLIDGRAMRFSAKGVGAYPLDGVPQGGVGVIIKVGDLRLCGFFGGTIRKDDGTKFLAGSADAPAGCFDMN